MNIKILIIDDDIQVVSSIGKTFTTMAHGFLVLTATSANEGYAILKEQRPDIVVVDVRLGPTSGMDLLKDFNEYYNDPRNRKYKPRYVVITAYPDDEIKRQALEVHGADAFLSKPFKDDEIRAAVYLSVEKILSDALGSISAYTKDIHKKEAVSTKQKLKQLDAKLEQDRQWLEDRKKTTE